MTQPPLTTLRGPLLNPRFDGSVTYLPDAAVQWDSAGTLTFVGDAKALPPHTPIDRTTTNLILPPLLDCHIHIPQWPIRGKFCDGVDGCPAGGRLLEGLQRNVFPFEARCADADHTAATVAAFAADTLAHGVVGGAAYMTVHAAATAAALTALPPQWSVGLVLMNQNCPPYLRTDEANLARDVADLAGRFGRRMILTDRFAVAVDTPMRRRAVRLAEQHNLRMQTHLNEQPAEKRFVEQTLYPQAGSYTAVYQQDGLLGREPILAHCIHMGDAEFDLVAAARGAAIAHCPTSNTLLGSGIMPLDAVLERGIPYAICTDVGASPTTSLLAEMAQFLKVHAARSSRATGAEALFHTTLAAARVLGLEQQLGTLAPGRPASFIEVQPFPAAATDAEDAIVRSLLGLSPGQLGNFAERSETAAVAKGGVENAKVLDWLAKDFEQTAAALDQKVQRVTLAGQRQWTREGA